MSTAWVLGNWIMTPISSPRLDFGSGEKRNVRGWNSSLCPNVITIPLQALVETEQQNYSGEGRVRGGRDRGRKVWKRTACHPALHRLWRSPTLPHGHQCRTIHVWLSRIFSIYPLTNKQHIFAVNKLEKLHDNHSRAFKEVVNGRFIYISVSVHF